MYILSYRNLLLLGAISTTTKSIVPPDPSSTPIISPPGVELTITMTTTGHGQHPADGQRQEDGLVQVRHCHHPTTY